MEVFPISKISKSIIVLLIVTLFIFSYSEKGYVIDWENFKNENEMKLQEVNKKEDKVIIKYHIAISKANLGQVTESRKEFDEIEELIGKKRFKDLISPFIKEIDEIKNNILYLNYGAFYYLVFENNEKSAKYFEEIIKIEPENIWAINYLAANYIELNKINKAKKILKKADNIKSNKFSNLLFAYIYYKEGDYLKAMNKFSQSGNLIKENFIE
ncbi:MAG: tetratricopeptide repeat protein [Bacillota bacterium]